MARRTRNLVSAAVAALVLGPGCTAAAAAGSVVHDGAARFEVLTPTLIRLEYAADKHFENRHTMNVVHRPGAPFRTRVRNGTRIITTSALTLRYRRGSGPFTQANLSITLRVAGRKVTAQPNWQPGAKPGNLGGWFRSFDNDINSAPLHDGLLSRSGWYLLDDTATVLLVRQSPGFVVRPPHAGSYQDGYFFGYGHDYARGLRDLRAITGAAPLLPRKAFGVWFSKYYPYTEDDYHALIGQFRATHVPLDTLSVDTDFKREGNPLGAEVGAATVGTPGKPFAWNGWEWGTSLFPDPPRFLSWAHSQGLSVALNVHPSISSADPRYAQAEATAGGLIDSACPITTADPTSRCGLFDWTNPKHIQAYFDLHAPFEKDGADFWWLDWCCDDSRAIAPGLTADTQINKLYAERSAARGSRWPAFSRIGGSYQAGFDGQGAGGPWAEHRYTLHFTGDNCASWNMLAFESDATAAEGSIGLPYVSHDIGSFNGVPVGGVCSPITAPTLAKHLPDDLYARWVEFGAFQPLERLHSNHQDRLPWEYPGAAGDAAANFLRLRERLGPYFYTLARESYDTGLPIARKLYLQWPELDAAYANKTEYTLGSDVLVAPVTSPGDPAQVNVWIPPGKWTDYFTGKRYRGPAAVSMSVPLSRMPVFVRDGMILPTQPDGDYTKPGPAPKLILTLYPGAAGAFDLYDDDGTDLGYKKRHYTDTEFVQGRVDGRRFVVIGVVNNGSFPGRLARRSYELHFIASARPRSVKAAGAHVDSWSYDAAARVTTISIDALARNSPAIVAIR